MKTPEEWLKDPSYNGIVILDPDGWRDGTDFNTEISQKEFKERLSQSTCTFPQGYFSV